MELSKEQIQQIQQYLQNINFDYQDLKPEIIDHMATAIEETMQKRNLDFKNAFALTRIKWNKNFRTINSFYFGNTNYAPRIVIEKAKQFYKFFYFGYFIAYFLPLLVFKDTKFNFTQNIHFGLQFTTYFATLLLIFVIYKTYKNPVKTVYSFIIKRNIFGKVFLAIFTMLVSYFSDNNISISLISVLIFLSFTNCYFYQKHLNELKKIQLI